MDLMKISKIMTNQDVAELLRNVAAAYLLEDEEKNRFRIIAYDRAADAIEHLSSEIKDVWDEGKLDEIPGVGTSITKHLNDIFKTGRSAHFDRVLNNVPKAVFELMKLPRIGAKKAYRLAKELKLDNKNPIASLEKRVNEGKIILLEGFGQESQSDIKNAIEEFKNKSNRLLLPYARNVAGDVIEWLTKDKVIKKADYLGSLRRGASTVGDIDIAVATEKPLEAIKRFVEYPKTAKVIEKGEKTASIKTSFGLQIDLMTSEPSAYGSLLQHFTGSKHHNIALREYAKSLNPALSLSEYGIKNLKTGQVMTVFREEKFYRRLNLSYIEPELREDTGEIEAAKQNKLPELIEVSDIKGDLQIHSDFDIETSHDLGESNMNEIVAKAGLLGYEYLAFTEHNPSRSHHQKSDMADLIKRKKEAVDIINDAIRVNGEYIVKSIDKYIYSDINKNNNITHNKKNKFKYAFNCLEIDILPDGRLAVNQEVINLLDFALVSIHSSFRQDKSEATKRVIAALSHPKVKIFAHPTGRKLNQREGVELDWTKIFEFCIHNNKWLEINADPMRLDLPDFLVKEAVENGVKLSLGTDAHHIDGMDNMYWGVIAARRGWAKKGDIVNCLPFDKFKSLID